MSGILQFVPTLSSMSFCTKLSSGRKRLLIPHVGPLLSLSSSSLAGTNFLGRSNLQLISVSGCFESYGVGGHLCGSASRSLNSAIIHQHDFVIIHNLLPFYVKPRRPLVLEHHLYEWTVVGDDCSKSVLLLSLLLLLLRCHCRLYTQHWHFTAADHLAAEDRLDH
jgi:hypothetical protein